MYKHRAKRNQNKNYFLVWMNNKNSSCISLSIIYSHSSSYCYGFTLYNSHSGKTISKATAANKIEDKAIGPQYQLSSEPFQISLRANTGGKSLGLRYNINEYYYYRQTFLQNGTALQVLFRIIMELYNGVLFMQSLIRISGKCRTTIDTPSLLSIMLFIGLFSSFFS